MQWKFFSIFFIGFFSFPITLLYADHQKPLDRFSSVRLKTFQELDQNRDGSVSRAEWPDYLNLFRELDRNADGRLTANEYFDRGDRFDRGQRFSQWDRDRNGIITGPEWKSDPALFHQLDRDENSVLSVQEFTAHDIDQRFRDFDRNRDGMISQREWTRDVSEFGKLDLNNDRMLSVEEYFERGDYAAREDRFREWDRNRDNVLQGNEWKSVPRLFHDLDTNGDSLVSFSEFMMTDREQADRGSISGRGRTAAPEYEEQWRSWDQDRDRVVSVREWRGNRYLFDLLDTNNDAVLSESEFFNRDTSFIFDRLDYNRDGRVSRNEWGGGRNVFNRLDADRDGVLSQSELSMLDEIVR